MHKNIYRITVAIYKLLKNMTIKSKVIYPMLLMYTFSLVISEISIAIFPKILLEIFSHDIEKKQILIFISIFMMIYSLLGVIYNWVRERVRVEFGYLRVNHLADAFEKIITCKYEYMEDATFFNRYDSAFDACSNAESGIEKIYNMIFECVANILVVIIVLVILSMFSPYISLIIFFHVCVSIFMKRTANIYKYNMREAISKINRKKKYFGRITQDFQYGKDIKLYNLKEFMLRKYELEINKYYKLYAEIKRKEFLFSLVSSITFVFVDLVLYGTFAIKAVGGISIGDITMYLVFSEILIKKMNDVAINISTIYGEGLYAADFYQFINSDLGNQNVKWESNIRRESASIEIENLSFKYPRSDRYIYKNLNLRINKGEKIAIVGENGTGKTTLIKILTGLFRDFEGDIKIDGKSIKQMNINELFSFFSVIFQEINLLAFSIEENIAGKSDEINEDKIWDILEFVGLKNKIAKYPRLLQQQIHKIIDNDGVEFSGGESQELAMARALYKDGCILVLDEPTAALDALAEKKLYEKFNEMSKEKTTIFISHRLASTQFCDRIVFLGEEGIIESGTHKELMVKKGKYYEMFIMQGKYYQNTNYKNQT